tara:strand:+ start:173 stop:694 length:522 start_codon:yes stop_codon:yes gene_type:complete
MKKSELRKLIREVISEQLLSNECSGLEGWLSTESGFAGAFNTEGETGPMTITDFCMGCADTEITQGPGMDILMNWITTYPGDTLGSQYFNFISTCGSGQCLFNGNDNPCSCCNYNPGAQSPSAPATPAAASMGTPMAPPTPGDMPGQPTASHNPIHPKKNRRSPQRRLPQRSS